MLQILIFLLQRPAIFHTFCMYIAGYAAVDVHNIFSHQIWYWGFQSSLLQYFVCIWYVLYRLNREAEIKVTTVSTVNSPNI